MTPYTPRYERSLEQLLYSPRSSSIDCIAGRRDGVEERGKPLTIQAVGIVTPYGGVGPYRKEISRTSAHSLARRYPLVGKE